MGDGADDATEREVIRYLGRFRWDRTMSDDSVAFIHADYVRHRGPLRAVVPDAPEHGDCAGGNCYTCNLAAAARGDALGGPTPAGPTDG